MTCCSVSPGGGEGGGGGGIVHHKNTFGIRPTRSPAGGRALLVSLEMTGGGLPGIAILCPECDTARSAAARNPTNLYTGTLTVARRPPIGLSPSVMSPPCERAMRSEE